jgi:hypothetical protein
MLVEDVRAQFAAERVGVQTQRKALMLLQGILRRAVVRGLIPANPEDHSLTYVAEQAGHSVATLAKHYAGVLDELEDEPRTPAAEVINAARNQLRCAQNVRTEQMGEGPLAGESPATVGVGDTGLEPVTSALSRRRSPS